MAENIVHLVLARVPDAPPGTKGISCFIVPKFLVNDDGSLGERNDVACVSIEHKMGIKASPTCVMSYGEAGDGAVGYLIGEANQGMRYMFTMMNNARLSVGLEGLALGRAGLPGRPASTPRSASRVGPRAPRRARRRFIVELPDVRRMLLTMKALIDAVRAIVYTNAQAIDLATHHPDDDVRQRNQELVELLTPVVEGVRHRHGHRGHLARHPGVRRHGLHRGVRRPPALPRRPDHRHLRGHQRHPGHGPRGPQAPDAWGCGDG